LGMLLIGVAVRGRHRRDKSIDVAHGWSVPLDS
jgi:hypothetical protein